MGMEGYSVSPVVAGVNSTAYSMSGMVGTSVGAMVGSVMSGSANEISSSTESSSVGGEDEPAIVSPVHQSSAPAYGRPFCPDNDNTVRWTFGTHRKWSYVATVRARVDWILRAVAVALCRLWSPRPLISRW